MVRRRTAGFAVERLGARVVLFFGAGIQRDLSRETEFTVRGIPQNGFTSGKFAAHIAQHPLQPKGSRPNWAKLPTILIARPNQFGEAFALNYGCGKASETLKTHRNPH